MAVANLRQESGEPEAEAGSQEDTENMETFLPGGQIAIYKHFYQEAR